MPNRRANAHPHEQQRQLLPETVISCSRRTDIPRWHARWLEEKLAAAHIGFRTPRGSWREVSLDPADVHSIVLISKDYSPLLRRESLLERLSRLNPYFHFTITGLGGTGWEPGVPGWREAVGQAAALVSRFGPERVNWRFDPIVHWPGDSGLASNLPLFEPIGCQLAALGIHSCVFSFAQWYRKSQRRAARAQMAFVDPSPDEKMEFATVLARHAGELGFSLASCSNHEWSAIPGIGVAHCIDGGLLTRLRGDGAAAPRRKDGGQRDQCGCTLSVDIGSYTQRCGKAHCVYCYAMP